MDGSAIGQTVRAPKSAAFAGLAFGLILGTVLYLLHSAIPESVPDSGTWVVDLSQREEVETALALIPFAGIAFLWFIAVVRSEVGKEGDRFLETVFLGSGLLFVAMLFAAAAVLMSVLAHGRRRRTRATRDGSPGSGPRLLAPGLLRSAHGCRLHDGRLVGRIRGGSMPRPLVALGYVTGLLLLLTPPMPPWAQLLFPLWVISLGIHVLRRGPDLPRDHPSSPRSGG